MKLLSKPARQRLEAMAANAALALFRALPLDAASGFGGWLARTVGPRLGVSNVARRNLARAFPDKSRREIETIVGQVWDNMGRLVAEFPHLSTILDQRVEIVGLDNLHRLRDDGQPGLLVGGHFGNWEVSGALMVRQGLDLTVVYRAPNNPLIEDIYRRCRSYADTGQVRKGPEGAREILTLLRNGGHVAMLVDQKMNDGIPVPFFGRDAMTAPAVARFAAKFKCPAIMVKTERLNGARFRVTFFPPLDLPAAGDTLAAMSAINRELEGWVRERPGQWLWLHRRWPEN